MPINKETVRISLPVIPELDKKATSNLMREVQDLERKLGPLRTSLSSIASQANTTIQSLKEVSSLSGKKGGKGGGGGGRRGRKKDADGAGDELDRLRKATKKAIEAQEDFAKNLREFKLEKLKGFKGAMDAIPKMFESGLKKGGTGAIGGLAHKGLERLIAGPSRAAMAVKAGPPGAVGASGIAAAGAKGGGGPGAAAGIEAAGAALGKAAMVGMGAAAALLAFIKLLQMASESQSKLNKALVEGSGTARDFGLSGEQYREVVNDLRIGVQNSTKDLLKLGGSSELTAKVIASFSKEATGSLAKTRSELIGLGGSATKGIAILTQASMAYGKALGLGPEEAAAMMGKFTTELGYSTEGSVNALGQVVQAAAGANMPMSKFMGIFNQVIPDVELYQNRMEELIGTMKLLSKTMSAKDVKNFMDAFAQGFKGADFKQRIRTVLTIGTAAVSDSLKRDFDGKAKSMAKNFAEYAEPGEDMAEKFQKAMAGGETTMSAFLNEMEVRAAKQGKSLQGTQRSDAMKVARFEGLRQKGEKGDAASMATAMSGAGLVGTYEIMEKLGKKLTGGFDGISEQVMASQGISKQQYDALVTTRQSLLQQRDMLKKYGKTTDKQFNRSLREAVKMRKSNMTEEEIEEAMATATDRELVQAAEWSNQEAETGAKALELGAEQYNMTTSIGDKLDNVIGFLLEQLLRVMNPILDVINGMFRWIVGGTDHKEDLKKMDDVVASLSGSGMSNETKAMANVVGDAVKKGIAEGKSGEDMAKAVAESGALDSLSKLDPKVIYEKMKAAGKGPADESSEYQVATSAAGKAMNRFADAQKRGDQAGMIAALQDLPGDFNENLIRMSHTLAQKGLVSSAGQARMAGREYKRPGVKASMTWQEKQDADKAKEAAKKAANIETNLVERGKKGAAGAQAAGAQAPISETQAASNQLAAFTGGGPDQGPPTPAAAGALTPVVVAAATAGAQAAAPAAAAAGAQAAAAGASGPAAAGPAHTDLTGPLEQSATAAVSTEDVQKKAADDANKAAEEAKKQAEEQYMGTQDLLSLMKKGIRFEQSWMGTKYKNILTEASLDAFRPALMEFAVLQEKIKGDEDLQKALASGQGWNFAASGKTGLDAVLGSEAGKGMEALHKLDPKTFGKVPETSGPTPEAAPGYATGGSIDYDQLARVHKGEFVVPRSGALVGGAGGGGGKTVNVGSITVNVQTDADPHQIAEAIHNVYRQS